MSELHIETESNREAFQPGGKIRGSVKWLLDKNVDALELSLFWRTEGKGTEDFALAETQRIDYPASSGQREFELTAPKGPFSFSGKLISIIWALELTVAEGKDFVRKDIIISPTKKEVVCTESIIDGKSQTGSGILGRLFKRR